MIYPLADTLIPSNFGALMGNKHFLLALIRQFNLESTFSNLISMKYLYSLLTLFFAAFTMNAQVLISEDFTNGVPAGWTQQTLSTDGGWLGGTAGSLSSQYWTIGDNGSQILATNDDGCNCDKSADYIITPMVDLSMAAGAIMSFDAVYGGYTYAGATEVATVEASTDGGSTWTVVETLTGTETNDWTSYTVDLGAYAGQASVWFAVKYNDGGGWTFGMAMDNFSLYVPQPDNAELTSISTANYQETGANVDIAGTITNLGANAITSMDITWGDGTNSYTDNLTGLNIAPLATYNFTHGTQFAVPAGATTITVDVTNVNGGMDPDMSDNSASVTISGVPFIPNKRVVMEEGTGTWCGWCPRGHVFMEYMQNTYPETFIGIAVHNSDPMTVSAYDTPYGGLISGYPSGTADRNPEWPDTDPSDFEVAHNALVNEVAPAEISIVNATYDPGTLTLTADVQVEFVVDLTGDYRLNMILVEDDVTGTSGSWAQANYYSFQTNNIALTGAGHDWQAQTDPVPAAEMEYDHVARALLGGFTGEAGSLPATMTAGSTYTYTFTAVMNGAWDPTNMHMIGLLQDNENGSFGQILNGVQASMPESVANVELLPENSVKVFPNPTTDMAFVQIEVEDASDVSFQIFNNLGQAVYSRNVGSLNGASAFPVEVAGFAAGMYHVHVSVDGKIITKKLMIGR